ncbi:zinc ribbon domain-containing protein [Mediterraneibacter massiliensis]|uniref:zinc ribbon domain-containing protein n=1 Tax=Mediterraneibacter massiliensis TaxID=1720300 RepID=UPI0024AE56C6|nr:zinc ribbon domain-containing protein [Mediterraneibacter massiliensis]
MAFLNDLDKKISMLGQGALQKTKEATDSVKISANLRGLESQKKEAFEQLGRAYYEFCAEQDIIPAGTEVAAKIHELDIQAEELKEQLRKIKGTIFCPNCNAEIPEDSKFCNVCGAKIELPEQTAETPEQAPSGRVCSSCGALLEEGQVFCVNCGAKVEEEAMPAAEEEAQAEVYTEAQPYEQAQEEVQKSVCPNCGKELKEGQKFCTGCGTPIG